MIALLTEPFGYEFMMRALATSLVASIVCALLSCWLVLVGWSLMGDAVSHAVLPGVVLAYILGVPFAVGAVQPSARILMSVFETVTIGSMARTKPGRSFGPVPARP